MSLRWGEVLERGAEIVESYDTSVTLRQLFCHLVAEGVLKNTRSAYTSLSSYSAKARRAGTLPAPLDQRRKISRAFFDLYMKRFSVPRASIDTSWCRYEPVR